MFSLLPRSPSDDNAIRCVFPVLWTTSRLPIIGDAKATLLRRILKGTHQGEGMTGRRSRDVYECLVYWMSAGRTRRTKTNELQRTNVVRFRYIG